jgi:hypothetical protein
MYIDSYLKSSMKREHFENEGIESYKDGYWEKLL